MDRTGSSNPHVQTSTDRSEIVGVKGNGEGAEAWVGGGGGLWGGGWGGVMWGGGGGESQKKKTNEERVVGGDYSDYPGAKIIVSTPQSAKG